MRAVPFLLVILLAGCGALRGVSVSNVATGQLSQAPCVPFVKERCTCHVAIEALFPDMAHDPITLLLSGRSKLVARFYVPKLSGTYGAEQVRVTYEGEKGNPWNVSNLSGTVSFTGDQVTINLTQTDSVRKAKPIHFNGTFTLNNLNACA